MRLTFLVVLTTMEWVAIKFGSDINVTLRMNCKYLVHMVQYLASQSH